MTADLRAAYLGHRDEHHRFGHYTSACSGRQDMRGGPAAGEAVQHPESRRTQPAEQVADTLCHRRDMRGVASIGRAPHDIAQGDGEAGPLGERQGTIAW